MSLAQVIDAVAAKAAGVSGMAGAWGAGVTPGVDGISLAPPPATPWAVVYLDSETASDPPAFGINQRDADLEVRIYIPAGSPGAYAALLGFVDAFETAWATDRDLGGTCQDSSYVRSGPVGNEDWGEVPYLVMPIRIHVFRWAYAALSA